MPQTLLASEKALNHEDGINLTNGLADIKNAIYGIGDNGNLAAIEVSPAESAHAVGTYLTYHGILYEVTAAIAVGDSLAEGTNIVKKTVDERFNEIEDFIDAKFDDDWTYIANQVAHGNGARLYPVASQFIIPHTEYGNMVFDVLHHITPASDAMLKAMLPTGKDYGMVLGMHHAIYSTQFDSEEALYYAEEAMPADTYVFRISSTWSQATAGYYKFTTTQTIPAGGQVGPIISIADTAPANWKVSTYADGSATTAIESNLVITSATDENDGTFLGNITSPTGNLNHIHRLGYGSNDWAESGMRQWLNADVASGWWTQQTNWDRYVSYYTRPGFLYGFGADFKGALLDATTRNRSNGVFDSHGLTQLYTTTDKMFLLACEEVGFEIESGIECGKVFDYYKNATDTDRIKYDISSQSTARLWFLRLPYPSNANTERNVSSSGARNYNYARHGRGAVAACIIG